MCACVNVCLCLQRSVLLAVGSVVEVDAKSIRLHVSFDLLLPMVHQGGGAYDERCLGNHQAGV